MSHDIRQENIFHDNWRGGGLTPQKASNAKCFSMSWFLHELQGQLWIRRFLTVYDWAAHADEKVDLYISEMQHPTTVNANAWDNRKTGKF